MYRAKIVTVRRGGKVTFELTAGSGATVTLTESELAGNYEDFLALLTRLVQSVKDQRGIA